MATFFLRFDFRTILLGTMAVGFVLVGTLHVYDYVVSLLKQHPLEQKSSPTDISTSTEEPQVVKPRRRRSRSVIPRERLETSRLRKTRSGRVY
ncbi:hypothetical protein J437_LFUL002341 [Ladona fulva]|uniref:Uncharacterized protein n=1 Tax=Ladona fulva TaxID=123851 RepID=A0A8K0K8H0_LADFU|nr:hypothetical protein J437_LFUL002341 [Ladona fulva]